MDHILPHLSRSAWEEAVAPLCDICTPCGIQGDFGCLQMSVFNVNSYVLIFYHVLGTM